MPPHTNEPLVDNENPFYCPEITAYQYMSSIRIFQASVEDISRFPYIHKLCNAFDNNDLRDSPESLALQIKPTCQSRCASPTNSFSLSDPLTVSNDQLDIKNDEPPADTGMDVTAYPGSISPKSTSLHCRLRKRHSDPSSNLSSDFFNQPSKRVKRSSSQIESSFVLSSKVDQLRFSGEQIQSSESGIPLQPITVTANKHSGLVFWPETDFRDISENSVNGYEPPHTVLVIVKKIEKILPSLRLEKQLDLATVTYQDLINNLGIKGLLIPQVLTLFSDTDIQHVNLSETMTEAGGLNLSRNEVLKAFKTPSSFPYLRRLVLSNVQLSDEDLVNLSDIKCLETLYLDDTQIGDAGVMNLIALKGSLSHLELSWNERITDDSIPTLYTFSALSFLSLKGTSVSMKGLRKLANTTKERGRRMSIIVPSSCELYLDNLEMEYDTQCKSPLVRDPALCFGLSSLILKTNLAAHAKKNLQISDCGTIADMESRLRKILERRQKDLIVQEFVLRGFL